MLLGILALYFFNAGGLLGWEGLGNPATFSILQFHAIGHLIPPDLQFWIFLAFFVGFAIKVPMFPFHTWLPDAHVEAPTAGSVILAGVLLKMGTYGFVRFSLPLLPDATRELLPWMAALSIIGIVYGALVAHGAEGHEEAGRLLVGEPPGLRHARHVRAERPGPERQRSCR